MILGPARHVLGEQGPELCRHLLAVAIVVRSAALLTLHHPSSDLNKAALCSGEVRCSCMSNRAVQRGLATNMCSSSGAQIMKEKQRFERVVVSREEALAMFQENKFKVEIITGLDAVRHCCAAILT